MKNEKWTLNTHIHFFIYKRKSTCSFLFSSKENKLENNNVRLTLAFSNFHYYRSNYLQYTLFI